MRSVAVYIICVSLAATSFAQEKGSPKNAYEWLSEEAFYVATVAAEPFVPDFDKMTEIMVLTTPSDLEWTGRFFPRRTRLFYSGDIRYMARTPEAITFKETYDLVAPHLKQGGYQYINELGDALVIRFYFGLDDLKGKEFYIDDKETMRKLMHGLCDKILSSPDSFFMARAHFMEILSKYPLVPGDPPYLKAEEEEGEGEGVRSKEEVVGAETPVAAKKAGRPSLLFYVGIGVLACVGAVLFLTRKR